MNTNNATLTITLQTNMGILPSLGYEGPLGMINFLPNGGKKQPECNAGKVIMDA